MKQEEFNAIRERLAFSRRPKLQYAPKQAQQDVESLINYVELLRSALNEHRNAFSAIQHILGVAESSNTPIDLVLLSVELARLDNLAYQVMEGNTVSD